MKTSKQPILIKVFNSGYLIALLLFLAGSIGSLCDGVIASKGLGVAELAAIGIVYPYTKAMECISLMFSSGSQVIIGRKIGQSRFDEVSKVFYTSLTFAAVLSVLIAAWMCVFASPVSRVFGANTEETLRPTVDYLVTLALGAPAHLLTLYLIPLLQLDEKKKLINAATIAMTVVNVTLNIIFVLNDMGIKGIGYSTSISYYVALIILSSHFFGKKNGILLKGSFAVSKTYLFQTIKEGTPTAFKNVSSIVFNTAVNNMIAMTGSTEAMAAFSVYKMTKFIFLSVSEAIINPVRMIQTMLREERDNKMLKMIFRYSMMKGIGLSALLSLLLCLFGRKAYSFMVSGAVLDETMTLMYYTVIVYILNTVVCYYLAYFQAINKSKLVYSISVVLNIGTLPIFYLLSRAFGSKGVWAGLSVQFVIITMYVLICACIIGRKNKGIVNKLLVLEPSDHERYKTFDFHIESFKDAEKSSLEFHDVCKSNIADRKKSYYCALSLEEIVFNILEYQKSVSERDPNIDVHIVIIGSEKMIMRVKDCSKERDPFVKYEYSTTGDELENLGIRIIKSLADDVKYSFIYGVNFITITI
ncbi:MAG: hypothetical protein IJ060_12480 [Oscillospiraceae bacterium]|nr:hypothetical protein [Oscillospiraceae bacterium]